jgi:hypothetical protein
MLGISVVFWLGHTTGRSSVKSQTANCEMDIPVYVTFHTHTHYHTYLPIAKKKQQWHCLCIDVHIAFYCNSDLRSFLVTFVTVGRPYWWNAPVSRMLQRPVALGSEKKRQTDTQHGQIHTAVRAECSVCLSCCNQNWYRLTFCGFPSIEYHLENTATVGRTEQAGARRWSCRIGGVTSCIIYRRFGRTCFHCP